MRYLIFGDVHGNLPALEKLFKIEKENYDMAISHGDVVNYGPWSNECVEFLSDSRGVISLRGNHEEAFLTGKYPGKNIITKEFFKVCYPQFEKKDLIIPYKEFHDLHDFSIRHTIGNKYFYPDSDLSGLELAKNHVIGHSHYQFDREIHNKRLINTGSIGQNRKFINLAEYVIIDELQNTVELKSFKYDINQVINKMEERRFPKICIDYYKSKARI